MADDTSDKVIISLDEYQNAINIIDAHIKQLDCKTEQYYTKSNCITYGQYTLDPHGNPIQATYLLEWAKWMEANRKECQLAVTNINGYYVSTVFLGIDHNFLSNPIGHPILWETMIFEEKGNSCYQDRYSTKKEALDGHEKAVEMAKKGKFDEDDI